MTINSNTRIQLIDGLRSFALLGIIMAHDGGWHAGWSLPQDVGVQYQTDTLSQIYDGIRWHFCHSLNIFLLFLK